MEQQQLFVQMALHSWNLQIERVGKFLDDLTDEQLLMRIAPNKNRISYIIGHLIAIDDNMLALFELGERSYAHLDEGFVKKPDGSVTGVPSPSDLRSAWKKSNEQLSKAFSKMSTADWFARHTSISAEDFIKEPGRNKLSVLLNRTNHVAYHRGQLMLVKKDD